MRRLGLFAAVFSIGLVLFMLLTGGLSDFFVTDEDPFREEKLERDTDGLNRFDIPYIDPKTRQLAFRIRGIVDSDSPFEFQTSALARTELSSVEISLFIQPPPAAAEESSDSTPNSTATTEPRIVTVNAGSALIDPESDLIQLTGGIVCVDPDGSSFETESLSVRMPDGQMSGRTPREGGRTAIEIFGEKSVRLEHGGFLELFGERGLRCEIDSANGFQNLTIRQPVIVAIDPERSGGFVGLAEGGGETSRQRSSTERVYVRSGGSLTLRTPTTSADTTSEAEDAERHIALFEREVTVFSGDVVDQLSADIDIPEERMECDQLELELRSVAGNATLEGAEARGTIDKPLTLYRALRSTTGDEVTTSLYAMKSNRIRWDAENNEAHVIDDERIVVAGPAGEFSAARAWFDNAQKELRLIDVRGTLSLRSLDLVGDEATRVADRWKLTADFGRLRFEPNANKGRDRRFFEATAEPSELVVFEEDRPDGIRLTGPVATYDDSTGAFQLQTRAGVRPEFIEGRSELVSNSIAARNRDGDERATTLDFEGDVSGNVLGPTFRRFVDESLRDEDAKRLQVATVDLSAHRLQLEWSKLESPTVAGSGEEDEPVRATGLTRVEATGNDSNPASLRSESGDRSSLALGERIVWTRADGVLALTGEGTEQRLELRDEVELTGRSLELDTLRTELRARDNVVGIVRSKALMRQEGPASGKERSRSDVRITASELTAIYTEASEVGEGASGESDGPTSSTQSKNTTRLVWESATARGTPVVIRDAEFEVTAQTINWIAGTSIIARGTLDPRPGSTEYQRPSVRYDSAFDGESVGYAEVIRVEEEADGQGYDVTLEREVEFDVSERTLFRATEDEKPMSEAEKRITAQQQELRWRLEAPLLEAILRRTAVDRPADSSDGNVLELELARVRCPNGVDVSSAQRGLVARGTGIDFERGSGRLVIGSGAENGGPQRLERRREDGSLDELTAEEIVLSTDPRTNSGDQVIAYLDTVLRATFQHDGGRQMAGAGSMLQMQADHMLVILEKALQGSRSSSELGVGSNIREMVAWGNVDLRTGEYRVVAPETRYERRSQRVTFFGSDNEKPRMLSGSSSMRDMRQFSIRWTANGIEYAEDRSRRPMDRTELREILERVDRVPTIREVAPR